MTVSLQNLVAHTIPLTGKHLIEASAGTGKTYNITRIYLRLLLERELTVEQILLMTFTKDATQELRGRIDSFIRQALNDWENLCQTDEYFAAIQARVSDERAKFLLTRALLFLDEAAIFTIHGFCKRVLSQHAFASGLPFNAQMESDTSELILEACQDCYRNLAKSNEDAFMLLSNFWSTPENFLFSFNKAISHSSPLSLVDEQTITEKFLALVEQAKNDLHDNQTLIATALIDTKKGAEQQTRQAEFDQLVQWLADAKVDINYACTVKMPTSFFHAGRFTKAYKTALLNVFSSVKSVKSVADKLAETLNKAQAYLIVQSAIYGIRAQVKARKQQLNVLNFDDLIKTLAQCLLLENLASESLTSESLTSESLTSESLTSESLTSESLTSESLTATETSNKAPKKKLSQTLFEQYPVALVDEFQDTDPQQFTILQAIYYHQNNDAGLYLIGDPKQAIYGFRGGDVFAYLSARSGCEYHWLMDTNWRSTPNMIAGYNQLFLGDNEQTDSTFGYSIPYQAVKAGKKECIENSTNTDKSDESDQNKASNKALQFVHFVSEHKSVNQSERPKMAAWCANEIIQLLAKNNHPSTNEIGAGKTINPKDIAILVRDGSEALAIKNALQAKNLASVFLSNRSNLLHCEQASQLIILLKGILHVENERLFIAALCCELLGFNSVKLHHLQQDELAYQQLKFTFIALRNQWQQRGFITMALTLMHQHFVIATKNKDRNLTNILHLFELLQSASQRFHQPQELLYWFEQQCSLDNPDIETELRLESDANLIRIVTQHGAKGLEYPIVFIPFATRHKDPLKFANKDVSYIEYHNTQGELCLSLDGSEQAKLAMSDEAYAESIRLLYVAVTRAEQCCYLLTTTFDKYHLSPLGKTLKWQDQDSIINNIKSLITKATQAIGLTQVHFDDLLDDSLSEQSDDLADSSHENTDKTNNEAHISVSQFTGKIERDWWLSSFSALSRNLRHGGVSSPDRDSQGIEKNTSSLFPEQVEEQIKEQVNEQAHRQNDEHLLRFQLTKGAHSGNLLHDILEHTDFCQPQWSETSKWPLVKYGELVSGYSEQDLYAWLQQIIDTPIAFQDEQAELNKPISIENSFSLAEICLDKTLRESEFYFPMEKASFTLLAKLLTDHRNSAKAANGDIRTSLPNRKVNLPSYQTLTGMMHGFIDLIFEHQGKYYLCDYKSNHLGNHFDDYLHDDLLLNIENNYYDLQYLIYCLALHRHLKHALGDYDVNKHFGGVYYFYLRGMNTNVNYVGRGIYYRQITLAELNTLDKLFSGKEC
ncbi:MAG: UvrD-helicase domain-containing protein [Colwellia sp.]